MDRWIADLGCCLLQVDTANVLGNVTRLKGELPARTSHIMRNVSWGQGMSTTVFPSSFHCGSHESQACPDDVRSGGV